MSEVTTCWVCSEKLNEEEVECPSKDENGDVICDECYREHYEQECPICCEYVHNDDIDPDIGSVIGIWEDAPGSGETLEPGYYRVLRMPFFMDGMIGSGSFFSSSLEKIAILDEDGLRAAKEAGAMAGPICKECQGTIEQTQDWQQETEEILFEK